MDDCIAELGVTYIGGGRPCTPGAAHQSGGQRTLWLSLTLEGSALAPNTGGRIGPTNPTWVLNTYDNITILTRTFYVSYCKQCKH
jgi:hypothetical protein